jgi:hypothetical protein
MQALAACLYSGWGRVQLAQHWLRLQAHRTLPVMSGTVTCADGQPRPAPSQAAVPARRWSLPYQSALQDSELLNHSGYLWLARSPGRLLVIFVR